ncbi:MAG: RHS repeat-associated core domain-containing protein [Chloroflexi bacterium]|nr:RHS repeat-associated core domain-containing protein [Ardenticatenaceae bacterium]MBL1128415.1 RHS repeat-associated core domain-containing protein [Chloroflexota bacterium]NOG34492.1 RHS repeat-associated core domain-containing protein [Chloroflexota bacterium]
MVLLYGSTPHTFWQNPANFNGTAQAAYAFTAEPGINTVRLKLMMNLDAGYLAFSNVVLGQQLTPATTAYRSLYSVAGQNIGQRLKEESSTPQLVDTFSDGDADGWTAAAGTWSIQNTGLGYAYQQTDTSSSASNSHHALTQNGMSRYRWRITFQSANRKAGLYFFASDAGNSQYHGYAYSVWQTETQLQLCENTPTGNNCNGSTDFPAANGGTHLYDVMYDPATGRLDLWRDGVYALSRQDSTPLTGGNHIAFKTQNSSVQFDDVRVTTFSNQLHYFFSDHLGSTSAIRYPDGSVTQTKYLPFGGYRGGSGGNPITDRGYTGHKHNDSLGLIYMNARYYSPYINRFISADNLVPDPTNPQQYNRYSYALNNALRYTDPSGHCIVQYSGEVRMNEYPYGTGGICSYTEHWEIEASHARQEMYYFNDRPEPDGWSLYVSVDPLQTPAIDATGGLELLVNHHTGAATLFAVVGGSVTLGNSVSGRVLVNNVYNIGDDNLNYAGLFVQVNGLVVKGVGLAGGIAYTPQQDDANFFTYWKNDPNSAYSNGLGLSVGLGGAMAGGPVEYIPLFTFTPGVGFEPHAGWYLFENDGQWWLSAQFAELIQLLAQYAGFDPENYNWNGGP